MSNGTLLSIRVIPPRQSSITLEVIRGLGCRAFRLNGTNIYSLPLAVQIGPFPGLNERCPVERMPPVLGPMQHA
jgi:hypothetical protein